MATCSSSTPFPKVSRKRADGEAGYILIGVLILVALFFIALAVAAPVVAKDIERDKEVEAVQRGKQYTRAIKLYYKKYGAYPSSIKQLENTNNIRYLRKRYTDPITGKDDWRLIHVGEAKVPVMGFFGKPLQPGQGSATTGMMGNGTGGTNSGGIGGNGQSSSPSFGGSSTFGNSGSSGASSSFGSGFSSNSSNSSDGTATAGGGSGAPAGVLPGMGGSQPSTGTNGTNTDGTNTNGTGTNGLGQNGSGTSSNGINGSSSSSSAFGGGGPIVGVGIPMNKKSLVVYHKQDAFNKWEFTYDPIQDQMMMSGGGIPGSTGTGTPIGGGNSTGFGGTNSQSGPTNTNPFGSNQSNSTNAPSTDGSSSSSTSTQSSTPPTQ